MLATAASSLPTGDGWTYEMKWDGVRAIAVVAGGELRLYSRTERDVTAQFPEVAGLAGALAGHDAVLDGELVVLDDAGRPSFEALQRHERAAALFLFDLLALDGEPLVDRPQHERRARLEALALQGPAWQTPAASGDGPAAWATARRLGLEGVVAKRLDAPYRSGQRSAAWQKVKNDRTQELVVGGWLPGANRLEDRLGSLLVGVHDDTGLRYAGRVGSGISDSTRAELERRLAALAVDAPPFVDPPRLRTAMWARPEVVVEVRFTEWTAAGVLRQPRFRGIRDDREAGTVVREELGPVP